MVIYNSFNASILIKLVDTSASMHGLNLIRPLAQLLSNWKTIFERLNASLWPKIVSDKSQWLIYLLLYSIKAQLDLL